MRYISLFSGIEAASCAWEGLGWQPVAFSEIDPFPSAVLEYHYPDVPNLGDITKIDWKEVLEKYGTVDLVVGGSPCQSFSISGKRESLSGESRLCFEYVRALREIRPNWFIWENVPGVYSTRDNAFGQFIYQISELGYHDLAYRTLDSQFFGVAQRRRRCILVGHIGEGTSSAAVLFDLESVSRNSKSSRQKREEITKSIGRCSDGSYTLKLRHTGSDSTAGGVGALIQNDVSATLSCAQDQTLFCLQGSMIGRNDNSGPNGGGVQEQLAYTLNTVDVPAISTLVFDEAQITSKQNGNNPQWNDPCHSLTANSRSELIRTSGGV